MCKVQFYSTSNCRVRTKDNSYFLKNLNLQFKSAASQFYSCCHWLKKAGIVLHLCAQFTYKTSCKSLDVLILYALKTILLMQFLAWASQFKMVHMCTRWSPSNESYIISLSTHDHVGRLTALLGNYPNVLKKSSRSYLPNWAINLSG